MKNQLLKFGFRYNECDPFIGKSTFTFETYEVPHLGETSDRFVYFSNESIIRDFKYNLPAKQVKTMCDIKKYIYNSKYFD